jgi:hypothetical protein
MLGLKVKHNCKAGQLHISQHAYIDSILQCFSFDELKPLSTPFDTQVHLTLEQALATAEEFTVMHDMLYHKALGTLNWATLTTCLDIAFAVLTVAHFATNSGLPHWDAIKCIFHYLAGTYNLWLSYGETKCTLKGYADADSSMTKDHCAMSEYAFLIDGGAVL